MTGKYPVKDFIDPAQLSKDLDIDQHDLSFSMERHSGLFAYYSRLAATAQQQLDQMEQMEQIVTARLDRKYRDQAAASGEKTTEAQIKAKVSLDPEAIAIRSAANKARMVSSLCKSSADSFRHRRDMIIQLAFNAREERKGSVRVMEEQQQQQQQMGRTLRRQRMENMTRTD